MDLTESSGLEENLEPAPKKHKLEEEQDSGASPVKSSADDSPVKSTPDVDGTLVEETPKTVEENSFSIQTEGSVGITEYLSNYSGFTGILKHRYSDFLVNEINQEKEVVHLTSFNLPEEKNTEEEHVVPSDVLSDDIIQQIEKLSQGISSDDVEIMVKDKDKAERTRLHHCFRQNYTNLKTFTKKVDDDYFIVVQFCKQGNPTRGMWPSQRPDYTHFVLYKENTDTMDATRTIASCLNMNPNAFTYAGTKDKRAKTCQRVSVYRVNAEKLIRLNTFLKTIKVGNISYEKASINLGDLFGNRFTVILRDISKTGPEIDEILTSFAEFGFINYFGLQRFGTTSVPTQAIGRSLILEDWKKAVELVLEPRGNSEPQDMQASRKIWWELRDAQQALNVLRRKNCIEGILLKGLATHSKKDYLNALNKIPRNTRLLYLHSYQSYIWNCIVSLRISRMGLKPVEGDLYILKSEDPDNKEAQVVTADVLNVGSVTINDVVLPLPGHSIQYPKNEVRNWYLDLLKKDGLSFSSFKTRVKEYSLGGCYRHILVQPEDVSWEVMKYDDPNQVLYASDYDKLQPGFHLEASNSGEKNALRLSFSLPSSAYATMAVREIMKMETTQMIEKSNNNK